MLSFCRLWLLLTIACLIGTAAAQASVIDLVPGQSFIVDFGLPNTFVGTVHDLEVVPSFMGTNAVYGDGSIYEQGSVSLTLGGSTAGSGTVDNFAAGVTWLGAFADASSLLSPAILVGNFATLAAPGAHGRFVFSVLQGDLSFDPDSLAVILGNGDGTYYPENSAEIRGEQTVDEPGDMALLAMTLLLGWRLRLSRWPRRSRRW